MAWYDPRDWDWGKVGNFLTGSGPPNQDYVRDTAKAGIAGAQGRNAPQMTGAQINMGPQDQFRQQELELARQLMSVSQGTRQGAGELATQRQGQRAVAQQMAMANMARGGGAALATRNAARNMSNIGLDVTGQAQQSALNDQAAARAQLAGVLGQGRSGDIGLATSQAGLDSQAGMANLEALLRQTGMNDQAIAQYLQFLASQQGKPGMLGPLLGTAGTIGGWAIGGPAGGAVGGKIGSGY